MRVIDAGPRPVGCAWEVVLGGALLLAERFNTLHDEIGLGEDAEVLRQHGLDLVDGGCGIVGVGLTAGRFPVKPTSSLIASISARNRATSERPIA